MITQLYQWFTFEQRKVIQIGVAHRQKATEIAFTLNVNSAFAPQRDGEGAESFWQLSSGIFFRKKDLRLGSSTPTRRRSARQRRRPSSSRSSPPSCSARSSPPRPTIDSRRATSTRAGPATPIRSGPRRGSARGTNTRNARSRRKATPTSTSSASCRPTSRATSPRWTS